jgi:hypothetical protein
LKRKLILKVHSKKDFDNSGALYGSLWTGLLHCIMNWKTRWLP